RSVWYRSGLARNIISIYVDWVLGSGLDLHSEASTDRKEIEKHLNDNSYDPYNRQPLTKDQLIPNKELKKRIIN
ncbi:MAG: hypothetical protein MJZ46_04635, partial [Bacteroidales bacterium]|nr:hypothetical protein [Bacteroidales bacterium]